MNNINSWISNNEQHLEACVNWIRLCLDNLIRHSNNTASAGMDIDSINNAKQTMKDLEKGEELPALILLSSHLELSEFDSKVLLLCLAMEMDTRIAQLCAQAQADINRPYPTFALAFQMFDNPDWSVLSPHAPLRHWRLLNINQHAIQTLTGAALSIDERILNYIKGLNYLDDRLMPLFDPLYIDTGDKQDINEPLAYSQFQIVKQTVNHLNYSKTHEKAPVIELVGHDSGSKQLISRYVALELGLNLYVIDMKMIPHETLEFETFTRLWQRESLLMPLALFIDATDDFDESILKRFLKRSTGVVFLNVLDSVTEYIHNKLTIEPVKPTLQEQVNLWQDNLTGLDEEKSKILAEQFSFSHNDILRLSKNSLNVVDGDQSATSTQININMWNECRFAARAGMDRLAKRIDVKSSWNKLVLPEEQLALLHQITSQVAKRNRVYEDWGFRDQMNRGLGINALFSGESGTGKSMAAEVIADALNLDLYRIDLSSVVSKYIGETEKNLRKLFDTAEDSGAILFFDEADSLFGKRSEIKDSHDRYANIEINYLLQRMEAYSGLAILATNSKEALDKAFIRRLRFIVDFPFPGLEQRKEIWQTIFPSNAPVDQNLDYDRLGKLNLTGGSILNIVVNSAFLAAKDSECISMPLILNAARTEFMKIERPVKESDFSYIANINHEN